jgi:GTP cyclohydrolase I
MKALAAILDDDYSEFHLGGSSQTPMREDAFIMDDDLKIELIEKKFGEIMHILGLDLNDDSLKGTPLRVAKMYVKEAFRGINRQ